MTDKTRLAEALQGLEQGIDDRLRSGASDEARAALRKYGRELYDLGGIGLMKDVGERVAHWNEAAYANRFALLDQAWDGIGQSSAAGGQWVAQ